MPARHRRTPPTICPADHILTPAELVQNGAKKDHNRNRLLCGKPKNDGPDKDLDLFNGGPDEDVDVADIIDDLG